VNKPQYELRRTLIVVEDDSEMRAMLAEILFQSGYSVFSSDDARNACEIARAVRPAAVLCDVVMPNMSGFEAAERLKLQPETRGTPLILMTGHSYLSDGRAANARWLFKPFTMDQLTNVVAQTVR
jgi:CheY-like chemotaxis protein